MVPKKVEQINDHLFIDTSSISSLFSSTCSFFFSSFALSTIRSRIIMDQLYKELVKYLFRQSIPEKTDLKLLFLSFLLPELTSHTVPHRPTHHRPTPSVRSVRCKEPSVLFGCKTEPALQTTQYAVDKPLSPFSHA